MPKIIQIQIQPEDTLNQEKILRLAMKKAHLAEHDFKHWEIKKKSIDARRKPVKIQLAVSFYLTDDKLPEFEVSRFENVNHSPSVHIIGAGPAGLFAALACLENGFKPVIYERGKDVKSRRRDLASLNKEHVLNPESNYCFGEGGAGTYSDGKLYTRSTKRGDVNQVLKYLVKHGADTDILVDSHPHIGTNKLPKIIEAIRATIIEHGGEVHFNSKLTDLDLENGKIKSIKINDTLEISVDHVILATGHSARDIFTLLRKKNIQIEYKPFSLGVRVEHPQELINHIQYHGDSANEFLPPASYSLVHQASGKGVYSFCMCPGGIIAPCATDKEEVVSNGWSPSKRNNPYANSGIVVEVPEELVNKYAHHGELRGIELQKSVEKACWEAAGKTQKLPAQRLVDFIEGKKSDSLPKCSYVPGVVSCRVDRILPAEISVRLKEGFRLFGKKLNGFLTNEALVVAPESRTSSPVRIPRTEEKMHPEVQGLYPCGEGAGYAGGIMSACIDGIKIVESIKSKLYV